MKKKGLIGRLAALSVVLCLITMSLTAGTLAKYVSEASGNAKAQVAKWNIAFKNGDGTKTFTDTIELYLSDTAKSANDKKLVAADRIAPETSGSLGFQVDGTGTEVAYTYTVEFDLSSLNGMPLAFYDNADCSGDKLDASATENKITMSGTILADGTAQDGATGTETIYWKWDSTDIGTGSDDERDTALGKAGQTFTIPVTIKAEQKVS